MSPLGRKYIYVVEFESRVKVGLSQFPEQRICSLRWDKGNRQQIRRFWISDKIENAFPFEQRLLSAFRDSRISGEYLSADFDSIVALATRWIAFDCHTGKQRAELAFPSGDYPLWKKPRSMKAFKECGRRLLLSLNRQFKGILGTRYNCKRKDGRVDIRCSPNRRNDERRFKDPKRPR